MAARVKWEDTKKDKIKMDKLAAEVATKFGFGSKPKPIKKAAASTMARQRGTTKPVPKATKKATPTPKPKPKPKPKPSKGPTQRQMLDVPNMTPAQKIAYLKQQQKYAY